MRIQLFTSCLSLLATLAAATTTTTVTLRIPPTHALPNPRSLPPSTHATLTSFHTKSTAYLTPSNTLVFHNVSEGSYLVDVHSLTHAFAPLRLDVLSLQVGGEPEKGKATPTTNLKVVAWETFRGNDWDNKGEAVAVTDGLLEMRLRFAKSFYMERSSFNVLSILKNPMVLLGLVSMVIFLGMPYLVDNMDPEMRKEWEESQKSNPMNSIMGGGQASQNPMQNFDMAAFLAGSSNKENNNNGDNSGSGTPKKEKGGKR